MKLGEALADMIRFGDLDEAPWPNEWLSGLAANTPTDPESYLRINIAATLLKIMNNSAGGSCSTYDDLVRPFLQMDIDKPSY